MYKVNDAVVYGSQGVCIVTSIAERKFGGEIKKYLVLKPVYDRRDTIFVPLDNQLLYSRLHRVLTSEEVEQIIEHIPEDEYIWIENESERKDCYKKVLSGGNRQEISRVIKTLFFRRSEKEKIGKKLHSSDERILKEAEKLLFDEFAFVLNISPDEVLLLIRKKLSLCGLKHLC